ncbi:MAG: tRNA (adenosine(37)-N6)-threonylcarbamoyltransferase complex dimerization subunit type 1 TsaB [Bdellovibrio sp. CG10_big_fil_rev_8_21_14_0_10_47_8]|nr:MAG: tRNA (adenosine(37)-N6)-threonylcarbamoyltransferase complex dimerization subunit type 1 TsaB [Bdellovibrio sp. CG10_big_fil_rev_8_21_14_0_10_47_8]
MKVLALESSTALGSVAISADGNILASASSNNPKAHAEFMNPAIESCLKQASLKLQDIDLIAVSQGPGSFTGIRVAGNIAKTLAMTLGRQMLVLDSLTVLYQGSLVQGLPLTATVLCLINAYKNMCYVAVFSSGKNLLAPTAMKLTEIESIIFPEGQPLFGLGDGFKAYENRFTPSFLAKVIRESRFADFPSASTLAQGAPQLLKNYPTIEWNLFLPLYLRGSEAEENLRKA